VVPAGCIPRKGKIRLNIDFPGKHGDRLGGISEFSVLGEREKNVRDAYSRLIVEGEFRGNQVAFFHRAMNEPLVSNREAKQQGITPPGFIPVLRQYGFNLYGGSP
jgi:hypothetical protein